MSNPMRTLEMPFNEFMALACHARKQAIGIKAEKECAHILEATGTVDAMANSYAIYMAKRGVYGLKSQIDKNLRLQVALVELPMRVHLQEIEETAQKLEKNKGRFLKRTAVISGSTSLAFCAVTGKQFGHVGGADIIALSFGFIGSITIAALVEWSRSSQKKSLNVAASLIKEWAKTSEEITGTEV